MKREHFLLTALIAIPTASFAWLKNLIRPDKVFKVAAGKNRMDTKTKYGFGNSNFLKISQADTDGDLCIFEGEALGKGGPRLHIHHEQDEMLIITEGKFRVQVGDDIFDAGVGDTVFLPRKVPHTMANMTDGKGKLINIYQPAGQMEAFFELMGTRTTRSSLEEAKEFFKSHGMEIVGSSLSVD